MCGWRKKVSKVSKWNFGSGFLPANLALSWHWPDSRPANGWLGGWRGWFSSSSLQVKWTSRGGERGLENQTKKRLLKPLRSRGVKFKPFDGELAMKTSYFMPPRKFTRMKFVPHLCLQPCLLRVVLLLSWAPCEMWRFPLLTALLSFSDRGGNLTLLHFLLGLKTAADDELVAELVVNILKVCPDLLNKYFKEVTFSFLPRVKATWSNNIKLLNKVKSHGSLKVYEMGGR